MNFRRVSAIILVLVVCGEISRVAAQSEFILGPILGFTGNGSGGIQRIIGIPGASLLGNPLQFDVEIAQAVISPTQRYALAVRGEDARPVVIGLTPDAAPLTEIEVLHRRPDVISISPMGSSAAAYYSEFNIVQVIRGLPRNPELIHEFDLSVIAGRAVDVAVSDDGANVLVKFDVAEAGDVAGGMARRVEIWSMSSLGFQRIAWGRSSAAAFLPNRHAAVVTDEDGLKAFLITDVEQPSNRILLFSASESLDGIAELSTAAVSADSGKVLLADAISGTVVVVNLETRKSAFVRCNCSLTGLYRMKGNAVFRLNEPSGDPLLVLDASSSELRILVIPPAPGEFENE